MTEGFTAVIQRHEEWWIGWVEEVPGVNSQGATRAELLDNLRDALEEALEMNRGDARAAARRGVRGSESGAGEAARPDPPPPAAWVWPDPGGAAALVVGQPRDKPAVGGPASHRADLARKICRDLDIPDP